jgi:L-lactate utilization protein LutC
MDALEKNGIHAVAVDSKADALQKVLELIPEHAQVFSATSETLRAIGLDQALLDSGKYDAVRPKLMALFQEGKVREQRRLGASPDYIVGSVHAVTESGQAVVASASGSQLGPYGYGAEKVIWVVGTQKIVRDLDEAMERLREYTFPLENARAQRAYGVGSAIAKLLIVNREIEPGRITLIFVREDLGF